MTARKGDLRRGDWRAALKLVDSRDRRVQVWQQTENAWIVTLPLRGSAEFASEALGDRVALDALYRNAGL